MQIVAVTDPTAMGLSHQAMLGINVDADVRPIVEALDEIESVQYLVMTAGRYDIIAEIFSSDADEFVDLVNGQIRSIVGVQGIEILSYIQLVKQTYNWGSA